jgi:monoamine oxidase
VRELTDGARTRARARGRRPRDGRPAGGDLPGGSAATSPAARTSTPGCTTRGRGSYAAFLVGQYTRFSQRVRAGREGGVHFAGEHTDTDQQGYIDGAVRSGERAARELIG